MKDRKIRKNRILWLFVIASTAIAIAIICCWFNAKKIEEKRQAVEAVITQIQFSNSDEYMSLKTNFLPLYMDEDLLNKAFIDDPVITVNTHDDVYEDFSYIDCTKMTLSVKAVEVTIHDDHFICQSTCSTNTAKNLVINYYGTVDDENNICINSLSGAGILFDEKGAYYRIH